MQREEARRLLGLAPGASPAEVERAFRRRAKAAHPDRGGDPDAFRELLAARAALISTASRTRGPEGGGTRTRLVVRHSRARRLYRALRARLPHRQPARVR